jgi:hypothetical protein
MKAWNGATLRPLSLVVKLKLWRHCFVMTTGRARLQPLAVHRIPEGLSKDLVRERLPLTFHPFRASVVLEHAAPGIDRLVTLAIPVIRIHWPEFLASAALLEMEMILLVVRVDGAAATVAPENRKPVGHRFSEFF